MFILRLYDRNGAELQLGDIVRISDGRYWHFYAEVKYLKDGAITPFHTFSFHSFEKIEKLPEGVVKSTEPLYNIWYKPSDMLDESDEDHLADKFKAYLASWRYCEHWIDKECYRIEPMQKNIQHRLDF